MFLDKGARLLDARSFFLFYATGITPAMSMKAVGVGSQYAVAFVDAKKQPLDGSRNYRLRFPAGIPAKDFWSLVPYDNQTRSQLQTDQQFPSIGSQKQGVVSESDGSVDVFFGPKPPPGKEGNWVQTWTGKGWNVILRLYGPLQPFFDKTWKPGRSKRRPEDGEGRRSSVDFIDREQVLFQRHCISFFMPARCAATIRPRASVG